MLSNSLSVFIPSTFGPTEAATQEQIESARRYVVTSLASRFGGVTVTDGVGAWISPDSRRLIEEPVKIARSWFDGDQEEAAAFAFGVAEVLRDTLKQECVAVEINGTLHFV